MKRKKSFKEVSRTQENAVGYGFFVGKFQINSKWFFHSQIRKITDKYLVE